MIQRTKDVFSSFTSDTVKMMSSLAILLERTHDLQSKYDGKIDEGDSYQLKQLELYIKLATKTARKLSSSKRSVGK